MLLGEYDRVPSLFIDGSNTHCLGISSMTGRHSESTRGTARLVVGLLKFVHVSNARNAC